MDTQTKNEVISSEELGTFLDHFNRRELQYLIELDSIKELELPNAHGELLKITYKVIPTSKCDCKSTKALILRTITGSGQMIETFDSYRLGMRDSITIVNVNGHWWAI